MAMEFGFIEWNRCLVCGLPTDSPLCDIPIPGVPLTTRQPVEYSWMSGYPTPLTKIGAESPLYGGLYQNTKPIPNSSIWQHKVYMQVKMAT